MRESIKQYMTSHTKDFELEGVEFCEEDYEFAEQLVANGKSIEEACDETMQSIRDCLDAGLDDLE